VQGGVIYKLDTAGNYTVPYSFRGGSDGGAPLSGVTVDASGNLYGTTKNGGNTVACPGGSFAGPGCGVVYELDTANNYTVLYSFASGADCARSCGSVFRTTNGEIYGTTYRGGKKNVGVIFEIMPQ
jgi:uncharacterized repeat protein (TIGR03803 family)